jgi:hypothetical protein
VKRSLPRKSISVRSERGPRKPGHRRQPGGGRLFERRDAVDAARIAHREDHRCGAQPGSRALELQQLARRRRELERRPQAGAIHRHGVKAAAPHLGREVAFDGEA